MKKLFLISLCACLFCHNGPRLVFDNIQHDFGIVKQDSELKYTFLFKNTGNETLIIDNIKPGCGCTGILLSKEKIPAGQNGEIETTLQVGKREGKINKSIEVFSNDSSNNVIKLYLKAFVEMNTDSEK